MKYLYRLLSYEEIINNKIKTVDGRDVYFDSYVKRNSASRKSAISMTASLEYLLGHGLTDKSVDLETRKVAFIDISKLDRDYLHDIHSICKFTNKANCNQYRFPPDTDYRDTSHYSSRAIEFVYLGDISEDAYKIFDFSELLGHLELSYKDINLSNYPYVFDDRPYGISALGSQLRNNGLRSYASNLNSGTTRLDADWLYNHAVTCLSLGIYKTVEEFYFSIFGFNLSERYKPSNDEIIFLRTTFDKIVATRSYKHREKYFKSIDDIYHGKLTLSQNYNYEEVYINIKELFQNMFRK